MAEQTSPMPRPRIHRPLVAGGCYFFTVVTHGRRPVLVENIERLRHSFREVLRRRPFDLEAIVVLPDHLHTMWRLPPGDADFATRWMLIKRIFSAGMPHSTVRASAKAKRERDVWQRRFHDHLIRDLADWRRHLDYIHQNPVRHGLCASPADWPHSSFVRARRRGWYGEEWGEERASNAE